MKRLSEDSEMARVVETFVVALVLTLGALLLFTRLDDTYLWQDEAETALLARSVLEHGVPTAFDGRNLISQEGQREFSHDDYVWAWTPWLQHYATAASFAIFGVATWSARFPFVLFGLACLFVTHRLAKEITRDPVTGLLALLLVAFSVPFLVHMRQCRYYAPLSFFSILLMLQYVGVLRGRPYAHLGMIIAGTGLFHSHYVVAAALLATTVTHFGIRRARGRAQPGEFRRVAIGWSVTGLLAVPFALLFAEQTREQALPGLMRSLGALREAAYHVNLYVFPFALIFVALVSTFVRRRKGHDAPHRGQDGGRVDGGQLLVLSIFITVGLLCALMPWFFFRHYVALIPLCAVLQAMVVVELAKWRVIPASLLTALLVTTDLVPRTFPLTLRVSVKSVRHLQTGDERSADVVGEWARALPMAAYLRELNTDFTGPIEVTSRYLNEHAGPDDTLIATYGDLPLQFYTPLKVIGGLSGEDPTPHLNAEWLLVRTHTHRAGDRRLKDILARTIDFSRYEVIALPALDTPYENRPDPTYHKFRTVESGLPWVQLWHLRN